MNRVQPDFDGVTLDRLNEYRLWVDVELIFDSEDNFLYRQKGQLKLDNSMLEEFLPRLIHPSILKKFYLKAAHGPDFKDAVTKDTFIA